MKTHNARIESIANVALEADQTIGATVNWYLTHCPVPVDALKAAFETQGLDPDSLPAETTGVARLRELCIYVNQRIYRRDPNGGKREFVVSQVRHAETELVSFAYSANFASATERTRSVQIGTLTFDTRNDTFHWRFAADRKHQGETDANYIERCLASMPDFNAADLEFFARFADSILDEVAVYANAPHYDIVRLRDTLRELFIKAGCYTLSTRGGFWFAPRIGEDGGPFGRVERIMKAYEAADDRNRFMLLTMPKDAVTVETAATVVEEGLMARVQKIEDALDGVVEQKRAGQHKTRLDELASVIQQAELYREMLGMTTDALQSKIDGVRAIIAAQTSAYETELMNQTLALAQAKAKLPGFEALPRLDALAGLTAAFLRKASTVANKDGAADVIIGDLTLHVETDPTLGYLWIITTHTGVEIRSGSASTQKGFAEAIRALAD